MRRIKVLLWLLVTFLMVIVHAEVFGQDKDSRQTRFDRLDRNGDGKLERDELPRAIRGNFDRADKNGDGFISRKEDMEFANRSGARNTSPRGLPAGVKVIRDVPYVKDGHERQKLDLYLFEKKAEDSTPRPLVIWIHGGAWRAGSKERCPATFLLQQGFVVASINYRLSQHAKFPAQILDCKSAITWLRDHSKEYGIDADRFGVWGSSAGGHLAALVGTSANVAELEPGEKKKDQSRVQAVCDWFGPTDVLKMNEHAGKKGVMNHDSPQSPESQLIGGAIQKNQALARKLNPIEYLSSDDPPFLIMHGDQDFLVPLQQSQMLHQALEKKGLKSELVVIQGKGHGGFDPRTVRPQVEAFFNKHLHSSKKDRAKE